ncbi:MAG: hypothetical protein U5O39_15245 [Gammaproteobacteria bacterium]|nr:hypothetical protein [Gammaproteobacteria bacterium]
MTDTIDNDLINAAFVSSSCTGASPSLSGGVLTVSGISVPAGGACDIIFQGDIRSTATAGTQITNEADIMNGNGSGGTATAPTLLVSGAAAGSKPLYLDNVGTASRELTRVPPGVDTSTSIPPGASRTFNLDPATAAALDLDSGVIPASIWIEAATAGTYSLTARLRYNNTTVIGTDTIGGVTMTTGVAGAQQFPFRSIWPARSRTRPARTSTCVLPTTGHRRATRSSIAFWEPSSPRSC